MPRPDIEIEPEKDAGLGDSQTESQRGRIGKLTCKGFGHTRKAKEARNSLSRKLNKRGVAS